MAEPFLSDTVKITSLSCLPPHDCSNHLFQKKNLTEEFKIYVKKEEKKKVRTLDNEMQFSRYLSSCFKMKVALSNVFH